MGATLAGMVGGMLLLATSAGPAAADSCLIALDAGHSVAHGGTTSARGAMEWTFNLALAQAVEAKLKEKGLPVVFLNPDGKDVALEDRTAAAVAAGATLFVSLHHDGVQDRYKSWWTWGGKRLQYSDKFRGYSLFLSGKNAQRQESALVAIAIGRALRSYGLKPTLHHGEAIPGEGRPILDADRGIYQFDDLVVLKSAPMAAVLLEAGVIEHREEELLAGKPQYREAVAAAIAEAGRQHCGRMETALPSAPETETPPE